VTDVTRIWDNHVTRAHARNSSFRKTRHIRHRSVSQYGCGGSLGMTCSPISPLALLVFLILNPRVSRACVSFFCVPVASPAAVAQFV
jgi:hypothetical protein